MTYDPSRDMPTTIAEWDALIDYYTTQSQTEHAAAVASVTAAAEAAYATLPESDDKPTLAAYVAQAVGAVEPVKDMTYWEEHFKRAGYYPLPLSEPEPEPTTEQLFAQLRSIREVKLREYDVKISQLDRLIRLNPDYAAYQLERAEWDAYATALCNLPAQEGAPWDGGMSLTPWPVMPE